MAVHVPLSVARRLRVAPARACRRTRSVELHVTSLDVVHSFWAVELGVKADANPGVDNVAYVETKGPTTFHVRCAELCGLWHGYMFNNGRVVEPAQFDTWASQATDVHRDQAVHGQARVAGWSTVLATRISPRRARRAG